MIKKENIWGSMIIMILVYLTGSLNAQVAVIVHPAVKDSVLSKSGLLDIYTGDRRFWESDQPIILLDLKDRNDIKKTFYNYLGKTPSRMKSIWMKNMLSGESDPPLAMKSEKEMLEKVAATPGAIGFISASMADNTVKLIALITAP